MRQCACRQSRGEGGVCGGVKAASCSPSSTSAGERSRRCGMRHRHVGERVMSTLCNLPRLAAAAAAAASGASGLLDEQKHAQGGGAVVDLWWCGGGRGESLDLWRPRACLVRTMTMYGY